MIKKISPFILALSLFLALVSPVLAQTGTGPEILESSARVGFPLQLSFSLSAKSDVNISDIRLHYTVDRERFAQVTSEVFIEFVPATTVNASWDWDLRNIGGLPPGANLEYWWTVVNANGARVETRPAKIRFDDNRRQWRNLTEGKVSIFWYEGEQSFANELMATAQQALVRLARDTGASPEKLITIYIYADARDLQGALIFPQEWTGGVSFGGFSIIAIGIAPRDINWGRRAMTHELTHQVIHQVIFNPYNDLPTWLDEGLAMYNEGPLEPQFAALLSKAVAEKSLISVRSLSSPFSAIPEQSFLSYAQSFSLLELLIKNYGQAKMLELLNTFRQGSTADEALNNVYGFDMDGLNRLWLDYIAPKPQVIKTPAEIISGLMAGLAAPATALFLFLGLSIERWAWRRGW